MAASNQAIGSQSLKRALRGGVTALLFVGPVMFLSGYAVDNSSLIWTMVCFFAIWSSSSAGMLYSGTVKKIERVQVLNDGGRLQRWLSSRALTTIVAATFSAFVALASVFWFSSLDRSEKTGLLLSISVYAAVISFLKSMMASEMKRFAATRMALCIGSWLFAGLMALAFFAYQLIFAGSMDVQPLAPVMDDIFSSAPHPHSGSLLVQYLTQGAELFNAVETYFLQQLIARDSSYGLLALPFYLVLSYNFALLISPFFIERIELRRIVLPISAQEVPPSVEGSALIAPSAWVTVCVFVAAMSFLEAEQAAESSLLATAVDRSATQIIVLAEEIDGLFYKPGTSDELICNKLAIYDGSPEAVGALRVEVRRAFAHMRGNVDGYLDMYYSLPAEYLRLVELATGDLAARLSLDLQEALAEGDPFQNVQAMMNEYLQDRDELTRIWIQERDTILEANRIEVPNAAELVVTASYGLKQLSQPPEDAIIIGLEARGLAASLAGVSGVVATKIVGKAAGKGLFKFAATAMSKMALAKAGGAAAGAAVGATVGSVVPVVGTIAGGAIGAGIGLAVGVAVDFALIKLDEIYSREKFREEILLVIAEEEERLLDRLWPASGGQSVCKEDLAS